MEPICATNEELRERALKKTSLMNRKDIPIGGMNDFLNRLIDNFYKERLMEFPKICEHTRIVNKQHLRQLTEVGYKTPTRYVAGKTYEGTVGWSKDKTFQHKWIIPNQLRYFMRNIVYVGFWDGKNAKVRDKFMKGILRGEDCWELLAWIRKQYGPNINKIEREKDQRQADLS